MSFTGRFTDRAGAYAASRPSYPPEAIEVLLAGRGDPAHLIVADLGAGTGISARLIASHGPRVLAVEPNAAMRDAAAPGDRVRFVNGTAEQTTLPAGSIDLVAAFQAWHWFDHAAAIAEAKRIVRPSGRMAAIYNERDERDPFTAGFGAIVRRYALDGTEQRRADALAGFAAAFPAIVRREFGYVHRLDRAGIHARATSSSYLPKDGAAADAMHREIDALCDANPAEGYELHLATLVAFADA
jgi:SAM-dependent methyltransferase